MSESAAYFSTSAPSVSRSEAVGWALVFGVVASVGLGILAWGILIVDMLVYGVATVLQPEALAAPDDGRYLLAFVFGVVVCMAGGPALAWLGFGAWSRSWPPLAQGLVAAVCAAVVAASALLLTLGFNPIDFVAAL